MSAIALLGVWTLWAGAASAETPDWACELRSRVVQIEPLGESDTAARPALGCGVGFLLGPRVVMTALHVLRAQKPEAYRIRRRPSVSGCPGASADQTLELAAAEVVVIPPAADRELAAADVGLLLLPAERALTGVGDDVLAATVPREFPIGWPRGALLARHFECKGDRDTVPAGETWEWLELSLPNRRTDAGRPVERARPRFEKAGLDLVKSGGYSGSPVLSEELAVVVGVYTERVDGEDGQSIGAATLLTDDRAIRALFEDERLGLDLPRGVPGWEARFLFGGAFAYEARVGERLDESQALAGRTWIAHELPFFPTDSRQVAFGVSLGGARRWTFYEERFEGPDGRALEAGETEVRGLWLVELGTLAHLGRLQRWRGLAELAGRLGLPADDAPGDEEVTMGGVARLGGARFFRVAEAELGPAIFASMAFEHGPGAVTRRYTGIRGRTEDRASTEDRWLPGVELGVIGAF